MGGGEAECVCVDRRDTSTLSELDEGEVLSTAPATPSPKVVFGPPATPAKVALASELREVAKDKLKEGHEGMKMRIKMGLSLYDREGVSYARILRIFLPVFIHLEKLQWQHKDHPVVGKMLMRTGVSRAMLQDMHHFRIPAPFEDVKELEAVAECVARLHEHANVAPEMLCAYMYLMQAAVLEASRDYKPSVARALAATAADDDGGLCALALEPGQDAGELLALLAAATDAVGAGLDAPARAAVIAEGAHVAAMNARLLRAVHLRKRWVAKGAAQAPVLVGLLGMAAARFSLAVYAWNLDIM